ncbi:MAG: mechanosensitive ion channel [Planctomycetes bacterium]|nr:mechanosensitive ion channel [Planctomycetota bacterium]
MLAVLLWVVVATASLAAQDAPSTDAPLSRASIQAALEEARASTTLPEADLQRVESLMKDALAHLDRAEGWRARAAELATQTAEAPELAKSLRESLRNAAPVASPVPPDPPTIERVQPLVDVAEADAAKARKRVDDLEAERRTQDEQRANLPQQLADVQSQVEAVETEIAAAGDGPFLEPLPNAQFVERLTRRDALAAELDVRQRELLASDVLSDLLDARHEVAVRDKNRAEETLRLWRDLLNDVRAEDARRAAAEAQRAEQDLIDGDPRIKELAEKNAALVARRTGPEGLAAKIKEVTELADQVDDALSSVQHDFDGVKEKVDNVGLTPAVGILLLDVKRKLGDLRVHEERVAQREDEIADAQLQRIVVREMHDQLADLDDVVRRKVEDLGIAPGSPTYETVERTVRDLYERRKETLSVLRGEYKTWFEQLEELDTDERRLVDLSKQLASYLDERVLRVRTAPPLHSDDSLVSNLAGAVEWLTDGEGWTDIVHAVTTRGPARPGSEVIGLLLLLGLVLLRPTFVRRIGEMADLVGRLRTDRYVYTVHTAVMTVLLAAPPALALWLVAGLVEPATGSTELGAAVATGLRTSALAWFLVEIVAKVCRPRGLAEEHFRWPEASLALARRHLRWFIPVALPAVFLVSVGEWYHVDSFRDSLGRLAFLGGQLAIAAFSLIVLNPSHGVLAPVMAAFPNGWVSRLRWLWFPLAVALPVSLAVQAYEGYWYTAIQLHERFRSTAMLVLGIGLSQAMVLRWLFVARRQLAVQQALRRRAAAEAEESGEGAHSGPLSPEELAGELDIDVTAVSVQSRRLVQIAVIVAFFTGVFIVWADVLPALRYFDRVPLWTHAVEVEKVTPGPDGRETVQLVSVPEAITLADVLLALAALGMTIAAARNVPGLLEIAVLRRLPMTRAGRYAVTSIARYAIGIIGTFLVFGAIGIGWSQVQWLAAAVSVGLGFGLQEIFANFVSGLILFLERPIRVGDTVTVGEVVGQVTRIHMRATTIQTWDRTELVVPNREFITGELVNWTLSDSTLRVISKVGIAYGSDTELATRILKSVAAECDDVLEEPEPRVVFCAFGESTLDFELRVFVDDPDLYRVIHHKLNMEIDRRFREAGIEIAFPQRDLHIRSSSVPLSLAASSIPAGAIVRGDAPEGGG